MRRDTNWIVIGAILWVAIPLIVHGQTASTSGDEQAIRQLSASLQEAFDRGEAKALAALWIEQGEYIDQFGYLLQGRVKIEQSFEQIFAKYRNAKLKIAIRSIAFPLQDLAVETGSTLLTGIQTEGPIEAHYSASYIRENGKWQLRRFHEAPPLPPSSYEHLKPLEWLIGDWVDEEVAIPGATQSTPVVYTTCRWSPNRNFLIREFTATVNDQVTTTGTQWIAWDAVSKRIRSWAFDSKGGIVVGLWSQEGDDWVVRIEEHMISGQKAISTESLKRESGDKHVWRVTDRSIGDERLPDQVVEVRRYK